MADTVVVEDDLSEFVVTKVERKRERVKVAIDWCSDAIIKLIFAVRDKQLLWNPEHSDHMSKLKRDAVWKEIAHEVFDDQYEADQLVAKWNNLRIQFKSYWAKHRRSWADRGGKQISWKYYKPMLFIAGNKRSSVKMESLDEIKHLPKSTPVRSTKMAQVKRRLTCPEHVSPKFSSPTSNRHSTTAGGEQQSVQKVEKPDSFQVFGNFVAEELRKIPDLVLANQVQRKLNRYLMDCMDEVDAAYCHQSISNN
ncbi:uncharacterized protein LOC131677055 isoform X1 [Topomyia yanbarensis]|uniref:uncharacterized protein LOC131677055 isoform X1 n=1 Tax=Topomyia yanbarensis TaxID=2498891 RepID=UPI00273C0A33|nr:uncharacterized protein LOC131677055 isoform X1 [Topomyia yanbarensis]